MNSKDQEVLICAVTLLEDIVKRIAIDKNLSSCDSIGLTRTIVNNTTGEEQTFLIGFPFHNPSRGYVFHEIKNGTYKDGSITCFYRDKGNMVTDAVLSDVNIIEDIFEIKDDDDTLSPRE